MGTVIDCKSLSESRRNLLRKQAQKMPVPPGLAVILVGEDPASQVYVRNKMKACQEVGFDSETYQMGENTTTEELIHKVNQLANDTRVHGILVQLPLPDHIDVNSVISAIPPEKDVDCQTPYNMGRLTLGSWDFSPCTPSGIIRILLETCGSLDGAHCVVVGRSNIVGKPLSIMLTQMNATVTLCHSRTENLAEITRNADVLISSVGKAGFITADMVSPGAVVIDVGINRNAEGKLVGDVCFEEVLDKASAVTPVPGGVGVMTVTSLLENTYKAALLASN